MRNKHLIAQLLLLSCSAVSPLAADNVSFTGDSHLTGTLSSLSEAGTLTLHSPLTPDPLLLKLDQVTQLTFNRPPQVPPAPSARLELINGDIFMGQVESLDSAALTFQIPLADRLTLPRHTLKSLQLGVQAPEVIYSGPRDAADWTQKIEPLPNWIYTEQALAADGAASSSKRFDLPERFTFKFRLKWESAPNFLITFADPLPQTATPVDRYLFLFNSAGLEIKREAATPARFQTVVTRSRTPDQFSTKTLNVEIRVDRRSSRIHLYLDGHLEITGSDPLPQVPTSGGITLVNRSQPGSTQGISSIELLSFDNTAARHLAEKPPAPALDGLITREDDRLSGQLIGIRTQDQTKIISLASPLQEQPLELSENDASTLFFSQKDPTAPPVPPSRFLVQLWDFSRISADSCSFTADQLLVKHPLLGLIKLNRSSVLELHRIAPETPNSPEE